MGALIFAAVGDVHGAHRRLIALVERRARATGATPRFVLQVGDFEANRDERDRRGRSPRAALGDFPEVLAGRLRFPWPVWFIGGNHEPYPWLDTLAPGTEIANRCRWLGWSGTRVIDHLRIGWLSGIHSARQFAAPRPAAAAPIPPGQAWKLSTYFRADDIARARGFGALEVLMLHDWPSGLIRRGDHPFADASVRPWTVGNAPARTVVETLRPPLVLCGHQHVAYRGEVAHADGEPTVVRCLASVEDGDPAVALFERRADGEIRELAGT
jgi:hypothetical protein